LNTIREKRFAIPEKSVRYGSTLILCLITRHQCITISAFCALEVGN
jgi:hypothetical protein